VDDSPTIIFDLDGTLVDSLQDITDALNTALIGLHRSSAGREQVRCWVGDGLRTLCRRAWPQADEAQVTRLMKSAEDHYRRGCVRTTRPYPNILKMLELLTKRGGRLAVLSNKPHELTLRVLQRLDMTRFFAEIRGATSEEKRKPSPSIALEMSNRMGACPRGVLFVGDSLVDIETARNASMRAVAVTWGFRSREELAAARPDVLVDEPLALLDLA
jgi:phosphoglycolate phosphatase